MGMVILFLFYLKLTTFLPISASEVASFFEFLFSSDLSLLKYISVGIYNNLEVHFVLWRERPKLPVYLT